MHNRVAMIIASKGFQPVEYEVPKKILQEAGFTVVTVSDKVGNAISKDDTKAHIDMALNDMQVVDFDGLIFIGGPGAMEHLDNDLSYRKIQEAVQLGKLIAAICIAPRILAKAGALVTKRATGWNEDGLLHEIFQKHAVVLDTDAKVIIDGKRVTATGPEVAQEFAQAILSII